MSVAEDLMAAASLLEKVGWARGRLSCNGKHCVLGAISQVTTGEAINYESLRRPRAKAAVSALAGHLGFKEENFTDLYHAVYIWNDQQDSGVVKKALLAAAHRVGA